MTISREGISTSSRSSSLRLRCEAGSNGRMRSMKSPKKSMRTGSGRVGGKMSRMSPRSEKVPRSSTRGTG